MNYFKDQNRKKVARRIVLFSLGGVFLVISVLVLSNVIWAMSVTIPDVGRLHNNQVRKSTQLYDRSGKVLLYDTNGLMRRTFVPIEEISPYLIDAIIAVEDASFYDHHGVRAGAVMRAIVANIGSKSLGQGGSTITQQVVKNTLLNEEKSLSKKIKEWILALRVERHFSKNEILETYFNEIPYGGIVYGAEEASKTYFHKSAKDLTLSEAGYLAALPQAPTYLSPWGPNLTNLKDRHDLVLDKMLEHGVISKDQHEKALEEEVDFEKRNIRNIKAPHFVFYVLSELEKKYGKEEPYNSGLQIITTLDWELQQESEEIIRTRAIQNGRNFRASNAALVAIDPKSGQILTMIGSRDFFDESIDGQVNVAVANRQPGSAFKPFAYATAFKKGYTPETVLFDLKTQFSTACAPYNFSNTYPCYTPNNHDNGFRGPMTMREALAQSINVVGVKTLYLAGLKNTIDTAQSLGITTLKDPERFGLSLALGGGEVTLLEMTGAYGAFANDGEWHRPTPILEIRTTKGDLIESYKANPQQALDKNIARKINDILSDNIARTPTFGSNSPLYFKDTVVASKTGTTNDNRDAWVIGYTPDIVVGAWAGNNDNTPMIRRNSSFVLAPTWHVVMNKVLARFPSTPFEPPEKESDLASLPPILAGEWQMGSSTKNVHEILYWLDKNDPRSGAPKNPYADPQLALWDYSVSLWAGNMTGIRGPDTMSLLTAIISPIHGSSVALNQPFTATAMSNETENILRVSYYLNGNYVGESDSAPFSLSIVPKEVGTATLHAVTESPLGNSEASITISVGDFTPMSISLTDER